MKSNETKPKGVLTNSDLDKIAGLLDKQFETRLAPLATKIELSDQLSAMETRLKTHIDEGIETMTGGMDSIYNELSGEIKSLQKVPR